MFVRTGLYLNEISSFISTLKQVVAYCQVFSESKIFDALHLEFEFPALTYTPFIALLVN